MNLNNPVDRLESQLPPQPETEYSLADFCRDVLESISDGWICDWSDTPQDRDFDYSALISPTVADGLDEDERTRAYGLLQQADKIVVEIAKETGWRSPIGLASNQRWRDYHANSTAELREIFQVILNHAT